MYILSNFTCCFCNFLFFLQNYTTAKATRLFFKKKKKSVLIFFSQWNFLSVSHYPNIWKSVGESGGEMPVFCAVLVSWLYFWDFEIANTCYSLRGTIWSCPLIKEEQKESALSDCCASNIGNRVFLPNLGAALVYVWPISKQILFFSKTRNWS